MAGSPLASSEAPRFTAAEERDAEFINALMQIAEDRRTETLGPNYFEWAREFFLFRPAFWQPQLEYQIKLRMPILQMMMLEEASDLTDFSPVFFINRQGRRRQEREDAFRTNWRAHNFNLEWFFAKLWSMLCHTGFIEVIAQPPTGVAIRARNPENVYPDPFPPSWRDWQYIVVRAPQSPDELMRQFPAARGRLPGVLAENQREMFFESRMGGVIGAGPMAIEMPPGAMQSVAIGRPPGADDFLSTDYLFIKDDSREDVAREIAGTRAAGQVLVPPKTIAKYPTGRLIVRTGKLKLYDGPNQYRRFPILPIFDLPPLYGTWGTPPVQYLIQLQHLAESMYSQVGENAIRMNYGYRAYADGVLLNPENLDKLGASLRFKTADDVAKSFRVIPPLPFSAQQTQIPMELIAQMRQLFGFSAERQGKLGAGNISPGLMDTAITAAQGITRMRARMLADAVEHAGRLVFETMVDWLDDTSFSEAFNGDFRTAPWQGVPFEELTGWQVHLDAASLKPMSASTLRSLVPVLANLQLLTPKYALRWLGVPDADLVAEEVQQQRQAQAAALMAAKTAKRSK